MVFHIRTRCMELRVESKPMPKDRLAMLLNYTVGTLTIVLAFAALYMFIGFMGR